MQSRLPNVHEGTWSAGLLVEDRNPAGEASGEENFSEITFRIPAVFHYKLAAETDRPSARVANTVCALWPMKYRC